MPSETYTWYDAAGTGTALNDGAVYDVRWGVDGRHWPKFEFITDSQYLVAGERVLLVKTQPRFFTVPLTVYGASASAVRTNLRILEEAFDPTRGIGRMKIVTVDSQTRYIDCFCDEWDAPEPKGASGVGIVGSTYIWVATFRAPWPYWYSSPAVSQTWNAGTGWGATNVSSVGNAKAYPVWTITPSTALTGITITNNTTGKVTQLSGMSATLPITITTKPGSESILRGSTNYAGYLTPASELWPLISGTNSITIATTGGVPTSVVASWYPAYLGV